MPSPDVEVIVGNHLRSDSAVREIADTRVSGRHPRNLDQPWIKVTQVGDELVRPHPIYLIATTVQLDCYGSNSEIDSHEEASTLARTAREALAALPEAQIDGAVCSAVRFGPLSRVPDTSLQPARERFTIDATIYLRSA